MPADSARAMLSTLVDQQAVMLATLNMFGVIAICLGFAATIIWLVPKPKGPIDTSGAHESLMEITMNTATVSAVLALAGSGIGALASVTTSWLTQHFQTREKRL